MSVDSQNCLCLLASPSLPFMKYVLQFRSLFGTENNCRLDFEDPSMVHSLGPLSLTLCPRSWRVVGGSFNGLVQKCSRLSDLWAGVERDFYTHLRKTAKTYLFHNVRAVSALNMMTFWSNYQPIGNSDFLLTILAVPAPL